MKICPNCNFERRPIDEGIIPETECPKCGMIYAKIEKYAAAATVEAGSLSQILTYQSYTVRKHILKLLGAAFNVLDPQGVSFLYANFKAFKLKEDIRLYSNEDMLHELMVIKARDILDFSATYDVEDSTTNEKIGALKRRGFQSMIKDEWIMMDPRDHEIGIIKEDSMALALIRRVVSDLIPESLSLEMNDNKVCSFEFEFNPFVTKLSIDLSHDIHGRLDKRMAIAAGILLCAIEGRHEGHISLDTGSSGTSMSDSSTDRSSDSSGDGGFFGGGDSGGGGAGGDFSGGDSGGGDSGGGGD